MKQINVIAWRANALELTRQWPTYVEAPDDLVRDRLQNIVNVLLDQGAHVQINQKADGYLVMVSVDNFRQA